MARDHDENLDDSQADNLDDSQADNLDRSLPEDNFNRSRVRIRKKKKPPRVTRRKVSYCPNTSSTSFNRSNRRSSEPRNSAASRQYKKINEQLAQTLNYVKVELNHAKNELLVVKGEKLALQTENATLRGQVDPQAMEQEVQRRLFESIGPVKDCLNAALDNVVGLSDNLTQGLRLTTATSRMSLNRQSGSSVALNRNSSIGGTVASASSFRMRNATNFPPPSSETPNRTLPKSMVSPMVAGHTIKRPKIQLNRIAMQGGIGGIFVGENPVEEAPAQPDQTAEEEDGQDEVEEESADEEQEEEIVTQSPDRPRRNRFNLTIIGEESRIEESPLPASQPMERLNESDEDDGVQVLSGNVIHHSDVSLLHTPQNQPAGPSPSSSGRRSRASVGRDLRISTEEVEQDVSIRRKSRTADSQRVSGMRQRLLSNPASPSLARTSVGGKPSRTSTGVAPRNASIGAMRSPAGSSTSVLSNTPLGRLSRSPYVDVMKTARHPHVLLSDLVISRHPAALGAASSQSPSPLHSRPSSSPVVMDNDDGDIEEEEQGGNVFNMSNIPADPSDSFLERMCEENPLEGPSWLFATIKKKKSKKSCKGRMTAARKLSTVLSMGSEESNSSARTTLSFDTSDLTADRSTDASEVSGFVPGENILDPDLVRNPGVEETRLDLVDMEETGAHGHELDDSGEDKENESAEGDENFIMVDGERTPLKELIFMNGGAAIRYNPELETGETVESLKEAKILLDNIGVKGRRYSIEQDRRLSEENSFSSARVRLSECYIDLSGGGACLVAPLDQMVNISGAGTPRREGSVSGATQGGSGIPRGGNVEQQEKGQERRSDSSGKKRKLSTLRDVDLKNAEVAPKRSRKTGGSPSRMGRVRHSNVRHSDVRRFSHANRESLGERQMSENQKRINDRKSKAFVPAFIPFTPPSKAKKATEKSQRMPRSKAAAQLLEIDDDTDEVGAESEPSTSSLASANDVLESDDTKDNEPDVNLKETSDSVELDQNMPDDDDSQNDDELDMIESPVITPKKKKKKAKSNFSRTRLSEFEISPEYSSRSKSAEPSKVVPLTSEIDEDFQDILEKVVESQPSKKSPTSGRNSPTEENIPPVGEEEEDLSLTAVSSLSQCIDSEPSLSPAKPPGDEEVSTSSKEVEPEPSKNSPDKGTVEIRKKAASESFKPAEAEITRRPRGRTTMVINYAETADSPVVETNKKGRSRNTSGKRGKSVDDSAKVNAETEETVTEKVKKSRTKHNSGDKNSRKTGKRGGEEIVTTNEAVVPLPDENHESVATNKDENARVSTEDNGDKKEESKSIESSSKTSDIPSQKEPNKESSNRKQSKKDSTEAAAPEEVKDEGRGRRRATSAISYKEPSIGKKLRQGDQHSASVYDDFVPQTKKGKKKK